MILNVRRRSGFPIALEDSEIYTLEQLERDELYTQLEDYERELRQREDLKEIKVQCTKLDEILIFVQSLHHYGPVIFDFTRSLVILDDVGGFEC